MSKKAGRRSNWIRICEVFPVVAAVFISFGILLSWASAQPVCIYAGGTGGAGQVAFWTDPLTLSGSSAFTWNNANNQLNVSTLCLSGSCQSSWPSVSSGWTTSGSYVYNNTAGVQVGIGTTSPGAKLQIGDASSPIEVRLEGPDGVAAASNLSFVDPAGRFTLFSDTSANNLILESNNVNNILSISRSSGNVGIGTTNPQKTLNVIGDFNYTGDLYSGATRGIPTADIQTGAITSSLIANNAVGATQLGTTISLGSGQSISFGTGTLNANQLNGQAASYYLNTGTSFAGDVSGTYGALAIGAGVIVNADVSGTAGIALSKLAATTASKALVSDASGFVSASSVTSTELGYVSDVTSAIQTQINAKAPTASPTFTGTVSAATITASGTVTANTFSGAGTSLTGTASSLTAGAATNLASGAAGKIPYQTGAGATSFSAAGTSGYALISGGTGAPTWTNTPSWSTITATNYFSTADGTNGYVTIYNDGSAAHTGFIEFRLGSGTRLGFIGDSGTNLQVALENGAALQVLNGNVGIGTPSPSALLQVNGNVAIGSMAVQSNHVLCWTSTKAIGYCSSSVSTTGTCTCTAIT